MTHDQPTAIMKARDLTPGINVRTQRFVWDTVAQVLPDGLTHIKIRFASGLQWTVPFNFKLNVEAS